MAREALVDATSVLSVQSILFSEREPTAVDLCNLASVVETFVLYDGCVAIDMSVEANRDLDTAVAELASVGLPIRLERWSIGSIAESLAESRTNAGLEAQPVIGVDFFTSLDDVDSEVLWYLDWLEQVRGSQRPRQAVTAALLKDDYDPAVAAALGRWAARNDVVASQTLFNVWLDREGVAFSEVAAGALLRTQLYLAVAEVMGVPYRPDSLRWPLAWRLLTGLQGTEGVGAALFALARAAEDRQIETARALGCVLSLPLPILLRPILDVVDNPRQVPAETVALRTSPEAVRLRDIVEEIELAGAAGDYKRLNRHLTTYSLALARAVGSPDHLSAVFALVGATGGAAPALVDPALKSIMAAGKASQSVVTAVRERWRERRFAAISAPLRSYPLARDSLADVQRVFGSCPSNEDLQLVARPGIAAQSGRN